MRDRIKKLSDAELTELREAIDVELGRRNAAAHIETQIQHVYESARDEGLIDGPEPGGEWTQPTGAHDSYMTGDVVTWGGAEWVSTVTPNVWEPGVSGWRQTSGPGGKDSPAPYQQPTGAHDAYNTGDLVTWNSAVYRAVQDAVVWSPTDWPAAWEMVTDE